MSNRFLASGATDVANVLAYAGAVVAGIGALIGSIITTRGRRHEAKASAADMLTEAAERVSRLNVRLDRENQEQRKELMQLTEAGEDLLAHRITEAEFAQYIRHVREVYG